MFMQFLLFNVTIKSKQTPEQDKQHSGADSGFGQEGTLLRLKVAHLVEQNHASKVSYLWLGSRASLRALEAFGFLMLKYAFSYILENLFSNFRHLLQHQKLIKIEH